MKKHGDNPLVLTETEDDNKSETYQHTYVNYHVQVILYEPKTKLTTPAEVEEYDFLEVLKGDHANPLIIGKISDETVRAFISKLILLHGVTKVYVSTYHFQVLCGTAFEEYGMMTKILNLIHTNLLPLGEQIPYYPAMAKSSDVSNWIIEPEYSKDNKAITSLKIINLDDENPRIVKKLKKVDQTLTAPNTAPEAAERPS